MTTSAALPPPPRAPAALVATLKATAPPSSSRYRPQRLSPLPFSWASPPASSFATTANVPVAVRSAYRRRTAARYAGGTPQFSTQAPDSATNSIATTTAITVELPPPSLSLSPPPRGYSRRHPAHHHRVTTPSRGPACYHLGAVPAVTLSTTTSELPPLSPFQAPPRACSRRRPANNHRVEASLAVTLPFITTGPPLSSPCPPPPPGCTRSHPAYHHHLAVAPAVALATTIAGLQLPSSCSEPPRGCLRRFLAAYVNGWLPYQLLPW